MGTAASLVGLLVLTTRAGYIATVPLVSRLGTRPTLLLAGLLAMGAAVAAQLIPGGQNGLILYPVVCVLGFAFASITLVLRVMTSELFDDSLVKGYSYLNLAVNAGSGSGPAVGALVLAVAPGQLLMGTAILQAIAIAAALKLKVAGPTPARTNIPTFSEVRPSLKKFLPFMLLSSMTFAIYGLIFNAFPSSVAAAHGSWVVGVMFAVNAGIIVIFQVLIGRVIQERTNGATDRLLTWAGLGNILIAISVVAIIFSISTWWAVVFLAIVIFTVGEMIFSPLYDSLTMELRGALGKPGAFALVGLSWGGFEALATTFGVILLSGTVTTQMVVWSVVAIVGVGVAVSFKTFSRSFASA